MLDAAELAELRADVEAELSGLCTIATVTDGATQTWPGATASVACLITNPATGGGELMYTGDEPSVVIHVPVGTPVTTGARITSGNTTYKVVDVDATRTDDLLMRLSCVEVRSPGGSS